MRSPILPCLAIMAGIVATTQAAGDDIAGRIAKQIRDAKEMDAAARQAILDDWTAADTPAKRAAAIPLCLARLYPEYRAALATQGKGDAAKALEAFLKVTKGQDAGRNPFLAAYSRLDAARMQLVTGDYISMLSQVEEINRSHRDAIVDTSEVDFLRVAGYAKLLKRAQALQYAEAFLADYPDASPAFRKPMTKLVSVLRATKTGSLEDVRDHMEAAGAHLAGASGSPAEATDLQGKVEKMLTTLIGDGEKPKKGPQAGNESRKEDDRKSEAGSDKEEKEEEDLESASRKLQRLKEKPPRQGQPKPPEMQQSEQSPQQGQSKSEQQSQSKQAGPPGSKSGEGQSQGSPGLASGTKVPSMTGAMESTLVGGESGPPANDGTAVARAAGERWGEMPPKERDRVLSVVGSSFPEAYRDLIEQYYRGLMDGRKPDEIQ